jgi:hypothetical protein
MIAFSVCNKPFKLLGLPSGRVKSRGGLPEMIPHKHNAKIHVYSKELNVTKIIILIY